MRAFPVQLPSGVRYWTVLDEDLSVVAEADAFLAPCHRPKALCRSGRSHVTDALDRLTVDREALLTTPYHRAAGRAREIARGAGRHGSCGMGIGETARYALSYDDAPRAGDCLSPGRLRHRLTALRDRLTGELGPFDAPDVGDCVDAFLAFARRVRVVGGEHLHDLLRGGDVVFEGAQGVLLDEWHGFHPYTTWSTTTFANAQTLLAEAGLPPATRLGVLRTYMTRHGPGPFVTEDPALTADLPDRHNAFGRWQGAFRVGHLDTVALRYALEVAGGADALALTHLDTALSRRDLRICRAYELHGEVLNRLPTGAPGDLNRQQRLTERLLTARPVYDDAPSDWITTIQEQLGVPVALASYGPTAADKRPLTRPPAIEPPQHPTSHASRLLP